MEETILHFDNIIHKLNKLQMPNETASSKLARTIKKKLIQQFDSPNYSLGEPSNASRIFSTNSA